ncbi:MAG: apolipoprotein N-acyltransferase [Sulfurospirillaceae bacterium]|nr:apolipoprotein N-acyltransferase [Sulfurospirillaceae bacterium]MDD2827621.1 apolipoprotein N-acyltransferase [Sulfurospirillaceae bacterium]
MKKLSSKNLAWESFRKIFLSNYFSVTYLIKAFFIAFCLSAFIYSAYFEITSFVLNSLLAVIGFYLLIGENRIVWFWSGFFIGLLWFYWISFSFVYYDLDYLIPLIILGVALSYGLLFWVIGRLSTNAFVQTVLLFSLSYIAPFGFNWFKPELILLNTYFSPNTLLFALFLNGITLVKTVPNYYKFIGIAMILFSFHMPHVPTQQTSLHVNIPSMHIEQSKRWDKAYQHDAIMLNFSLIEEAIKKGDSLIILPESAFPLYLNRENQLIAKLKMYSTQIAIVAGSLTYENENFYNSSYLFTQGEMQIAHKVILVPFGEEIPFPALITNFINRIFFDGAKDYQKAKEPQDFTISGEIFRSAICFEATTDLLYQGKPKQMIAISNNAWFTPSIEPTLQHLLLQLYARKYNTIIYHSANAGISGVIVP